MAVDGSRVRRPLIPGRQHALSELIRAGRVESPVGFVVGVAVLSCAGLAWLSVLASLTDHLHDLGTFVLLGTALTAIGAVLVRQCHPPERLRSSTAFVGMFTSWLVSVLVSTVTYLSLGTFARWDDAVFESVAGFTTTATTVLADPERLSNAALAWRAGTQWLGGLAALLFIVAVLPSIGVGGLEVTSAGQRYAGTQLRSHRTVVQMKRLGGFYAALTGVGLVLFLAGGMRLFDAITYAATTISTGGFANHTGSFGHFGSAAVEWAGVGGMILGGANLALLVRVLRGRDLRRLLRSFELRAYLGVIVVGGAVIALTTAPAGGFSHESVRRAYFHVASATSTAGHHVGDGWAVWDIGPQVLLLAIMGVGSMSGSTGGGFRMVRALALISYLRRELVLQIHPRAVASVRVGRSAVGEQLVNRMIGYQAQYLLVAGLGAIAVAALGADLITAISGAISSLANVGPAMGELTPGSGGVLDLPRPARAALLPLMLLGRLEIAPVLVGLAVVGSSFRRPGRVTAD